MRRARSAPPCECETATASVAEPSVALPHRPPQRQPTTALEQAMALRHELRALTNELGDLIGLLKAEQRQSRLVSSTLASLRQLERAAG